jgi:hypothetical protein
MCKTNLTHEDAFTFVQSRRFCVAPRTEFQHQLEVRFAPLSPCAPRLTMLLVRDRRTDRSSLRDRRWHWTQEHKLANELADEVERTTTMTRKQKGQCGLLSRSPFVYLLTLVCLCRDMDRDVDMTQRVLIPHWGAGPPT